jgi:hypothetical protein
MEPIGSEPRESDRDLASSQNVMLEYAQNVELASEGKKRAMAG